MPVKYKSTESLLKPDPRFKNELAGKFINCLMGAGKKVLAQRLLYAAMGLLEKKVPGIPPLEVFTKAIENVKPMVEVRSKRVGGATYQVPVEVNHRRQRSLAIRWVILAARRKKGKPMFVRLADELAAAYRNEGDAVTKKIDTHKMAEANRAFAHFAW